VPTFACWAIKRLGCVFLLVADGGSDLGGKISRYLCHSVIGAGVLSTLAIGALAMVGTSAVTSLGVVDRAAVVPPSPPESQPVTDGKGQSATNIPAAASAAADAGSKSAQPDKAASTGAPASPQKAATAQKAVTAAERAADTSEDTRRTSKVERHAKAADDADARTTRAKSGSHTRAASTEASEAKSQESEAKSQEAAGNSDRNEAKPQAEHSSKKHRRSARSARSRAREAESVQVYELPDGRRIIVRRPVAGADRNARLSERDGDAFGAFDAERRPRRGAAPYDFFFGPPDRF